MSRRSEGWPAGKVPTRLYNEERIKFLVTLANAPPPAQWTEEGLRVVRRQLTLFFAGDATFGDQNATFSPDSDSASYPRGLMAHLKALAEAQLNAFSSSDGYVVFEIGAKDVPLGIAVRRGPGGAAMSSMRGPVLGVWNMAVAFLLASRAGARVRRCADLKTCGRYFLKAGRMEYCKPGCARRVYMRGVRAQEKEALARKARSRNGRPARER